jgi:hypothetical protein
MLEYFTYKKLKKHHAEKLAKAEVKAPVLTLEDEHFLERIVSEEGTPPALPERPFTLNPEVGDPTNNDAQMVLHEDASRGVEDSDTSRDIEDRHEKHEKHKNKGKSKEHTHGKDKKKANRFSFLRRTPKKTDEPLEAATDVPPNEVVNEEDDITRVLDELNLAAVNNRAFSLSKESQVIVQKFTVILKDLINGVPAAYDDLVKLIDESSDQLSKNYKNLPGFLKKLIKGLPEKLTGHLGPELMAVATEAGGAAGAASASGLAGAAKRFLTPATLKDLVMKPGAVVGMLKAIINVLKLRWPAFIGTNVLLSVGLFGKSCPSILTFRTHWLTIRSAAIRLLVLP